MAHGFQVLNATHRIQIDQDFRNARVIATGTLAAGMHYLAMPYLVTDEIPIVLLRPSIISSYVGSVALWRYGDLFTGDFPNANGYLQMGGQHAFDYAICTATVGTPIADTATHGLLVYKTDGSIVYDSRHRHPNITQLLAKASDATSSGGYPNTFSISGYSDMPWLLGNPLMVTFNGVGETSSSQGCVMARVNSGFTSITVDFRDAAAPLTFPVFPALPDRSAYNPYSGRPAWFGVSHLA